MLNVGLLNAFLLGCVDLLFPKYFNSSNIILFTLGKQEVWKCIKLTDACK